MKASGNPNLYRASVLCGWMVALVVPTGAALPAVATETAQQAYQSKCSVCHDSGAGQAPRISDRALWRTLAQQGRTTLYLSAINGKPNTPMVAKGGFAELSDDQVRAIVDVMLAATGNADAPLTGAAGPTQVVSNAASASTGAARQPLSDTALSEAVAAHLLATLGKPGMRLDPYDGVITIRGLGIKVETRQGVTILAGVIDDPALIVRAETLTAAMPGVTRIVNRMVAAAMFDFD